MSAGFLLVLLLVGLLLLGQPLFVIMGTVTLFCYSMIGGVELQGVIEDIYFAGNKEVLLAIPLFVLAGNLMTQGVIAKRLIRIATAITAPIPSGLAISAVLSCGIFAAISGSSPVTLIAIGTTMFPALVKAGYKKDLSLGILSAGGTLGIVIPPSIPMIIFAIMSNVSVTDLFMAGVGPGILLVTLLSLYALFRGGRPPIGKFDWKEAKAALASGVWSMAMPLLILGGIYSGIFSATESAAVAAAYALLVELLIHRELKVKDLPKTLADTATTLGALFLILVLAVSLNKFMTFQEIPQKMVEFFAGAISSKVAFLLGVNVLLLIVGCFMDALSAILVLAPLLTPMAIHYGVNPIHFGVLMIVNLEIGYLTPPVGINLFVASSVFRQPLEDVIRAVIPLVAVMLVGLGIITFVPEISLFLLK